MKPFCWVILAACVGAFGFPSVTRAEAPSNGPSAGLPTLKSVHPDRHSPPDKQPCPDKSVLPDYDPESSTDDDDEPRLTLVRWFDGSSASLPFRVGLDDHALAQVRTSKAGCPPRWFPIRC